MAVALQFTDSVSLVDDANRGVSRTISGQCQEVGSLCQEVDQAFAVVTDSLIGVTFAVAALLGIELVSNVDLTIETNSGSSPADTIHLKANRPLVWRKNDGYFANPFGTNVTGFYITTTAPARLKGKVLT